MKNDLAAIMPKYDLMPKSFLIASNYKILSDNSPKL